MQFKSILRPPRSRSTATWELETHPLPWNDLPRLERIARTGDLEEQRALFREVEAIAGEHGHGRVIDGWEPGVAWLGGAFRTR
jgi:hypothetical protein